MAKGFQDTGKIEFVDGKSIESFLCIQSINEETQNVEPLLFLLKTIEEDHWNRFFLDAGIAFWRIIDEPDEDDIEEGDPVYDIGKEKNIIGAQIESIEAKSDIWKNEVSVTLEIVISTGQKIIVQHNENETELKSFPAN